MKNNVATTAQNNSTENLAYTLQKTKSKI